MRSPWRTFAIASAAVFLVSLDATVLYAAFPALRRAFPSASAADLSWVLNAYTVVYAALLVPAGRFADLRGRKQIFVAGVAIFIAASLACGLAPSSEALVAARVVQAVGAALLLPASLAIVLAAFPTTKRAVVVSLWGAVSGLAAAVGPSLGTLLVDHLGWRSVFFINVPIGGFALYRAITTLGESKNPDAGAPLDLVGIVLLIAGIGSLAYGLVRSEALGWSSATVVTAFALGLGSLAAFVAWARRVPAPAIDLSLFAHRTYRFVNLATLAFGVAFAMMFFSVFLFLTGVWGYSLSHAGLAAAPGPLLVIPTSIVCGRIAGRAGHRALLVGGALVFAAGSLWTSIVPGATPAYFTAWFPGLVLTGIGVGMVMPSLSAAAVADLPPARFGIGSAVNQAVRQIGSVLGVALAIVLVGRTPTLDNFDTLFHWQAGLALLTAVFALPVDTRPRLVPRM
ncbi:MAG TPA: DHA2 family efflux MFS transporter permease subunit [Kofleriaceae bacterium]